MFLMGSAKMDNDLTWTHLTTIAQLIIIPIILPALWYLIRVLGKITERLEQVEKDQVRTNALLETRQTQRDEDKQDMRALFLRLETALTRLTDRLEKLEHRGDIR